MTESRLANISIIGAGAVGASTAFTLVQSNMCNKLAIIDIAKEKIDGEVMDLIDAGAFSGGTEVIGGDDYSLCSDSDIIIITAGAAQKPGETRMDLVKKNVSIMTSICTQIKKHNSNALLIIVANPVDILTAVAQRVTGFAPEKVIGTGTLLDSGRLRAAVAEELDLPSNDVEAYVFGEHGDSQFVPWSLAQVDSLETSVDEISSEKRAEISKFVMRKAYEIIQRKGATYYGVASAIELLITHILDESDEPLPVSTYQKSEDGYGFYITCGLSCIGLEGVRKSAIPELTESEIIELQKSVTQLKEILSSLE